MTVSDLEVEEAARVLLGRVNAPEQEIYAAARAALEAAASARADVPVVKPLEWSQKAPPGRDHEPFHYWAAGIGGHYTVEPDGLLWMAHDEFAWEQFESQTAAKAAAQADYEARIRSALVSAPAQEGWKLGHPDDLAVDRFAAAMKAKLAKKRTEGRGGWEGSSCNAEILSDLLRKHVEKGDPLDVGNLAMMLHQRSERIV